MAGSEVVSIDHVPTREEVLEALGKRNVHDLDDLAEAVVAKARDAAESNEQGFESLDLLSTPWGYFLHTHHAE